MRYGSLIKLKKEYEERYIILHRHTFPGVLDRIRKSNIRNYSIYLHSDFLFSYYEYAGNDFDRDMAKIGEDLETQDWWKLIGPMQEPLESRKEGEWWASMDEIFHWPEIGAPSENTKRMALTTELLGHDRDRMIASLKIAYPILVETSRLTSIRNFSVYHKDGHLYSYLEYSGESSETDMENLRASLKVEDELDWLPMEEVFHTD